MNISSLLAELGKLLPTIKDWVIVVSAIVSIAGFILGLLGFLRSGRVERRTYQEPYFRSIWAELHEPISDHIPKMTKGISDLEKLLNSPENDWHQYESETIKTLTNDFDLQKFRWDYDISLEKCIRIYYRKCKKLKLLVDRYESLVFPITTDCVMYFSLIPLLQSMENKNGVDPSTTNEESKETIDEIKAICEKYVGGVEGIGRLSENKRYRFRLWLLRGQLRRQIRMAQHAKDKLSALLAYYDKRFPAG